MTWRVWVGAVAIQAAAITGAYAQATEMLPMDFSARARAEANGCQQACKLEFTTCNVTADGERRGVCDTKLVRCRIACQDCASKVARCGFEAKFSSAGFCSSQVGACRPQEDATGGRQALITFDGGDGSSTAQAVVIKGARTTREGLEAQSLWVGKNFWGWRRHARRPPAKDQSRVLDQVDFMTPQGEVRTVVFDVSEFYDKF